MAQLLAVSQCEIHCEIREAMLQGRVRAMHAFEAMQIRELRTALHKLTLLHTRKMKRLQMRAS
jgi:hypothetical protein